MIISMYLNSCELETSAFSNLSKIYGEAFLRKIVEKNFIIDVCQGPKYASERIVAKHIVKFHRIFPGLSEILIFNIVVNDHFHTLNILEV